MTIRVKICGLTNLEDALAACDAGADALGFVLAPEARKRNRYISLEDAALIIERLPSFILTVAVVVNAAPEHLQACAAIFDRLQLHGDESPEICRKLGPKAYKAFQVGPEMTMDAMHAYPGKCCLLDAWSQDERGGSGRVCDWQFAGQAAREKNIILAGGLTPDNVADAIQRVHPYAVDASSSLESAPGKKDHERIRTFIHNARQASLA